MLISMGVKDDWSFEMDFSKINDCELVSLDKESLVSLAKDFGFEEPSIFLYKFWNIPSGLSSYPKLS